MPLTLVEGKVETINNGKYLKQLGDFGMKNVFQEISHILVFDHKKKRKYFRENTLTQKNGNVFPYF